MSIRNAMQYGLEGLDRAEQALAQSARRLARWPLSLTTPLPQDSVDLSAEAVNLLAARTSFRANLKSIETADELAQSTLDLLG